MCIFEWPIVLIEVQLICTVWSVFIFSVTLKDKLPTPTLPSEALTEMKLLGAGLPGYGYNIVRPKKVDEVKYLPLHTQQRLLSRKQPTAEQLFLVQVFLEVKCFVTSFFMQHFSFPNNLQRSQKAI